MILQSKEVSALRAEIERLQAIERAARAYFMGYVQDEADDPEDCICGEEQHERAKALRDALGIIP